MEERKDRKLLPHTMRQCPIMPQEQYSVYPFLYLFQLEAGSAVPVDRGGGGGGGGQEVAAGGGDGCCAPVSASGHQKSEQKLD